MYDLAVVMPVYNEAECIAGVVNAWRSELTALGVPYQLIVLNDGSKDNTGEVLAGLGKGDERLEVVNKPNSGHGPTILMGYHKAVEAAPWVFQCDSDDEMKAEHFARLWSRRDDYDALFGCRAGRIQNLGRKVISACSRAAVRMFFGKGVTDVNTPYRLIRSDILRQILRQIPPDTFAPNVIISGAIARGGCRICNVEVPHEGRRTGTISIVKWKLWKSAFKSFWQTLRCRPKLGPAE
jgi:glycosyltransferase involved in cell wall biosynthesis